MVCTFNFWKLNFKFWCSMPTTDGKLKETDKEVFMNGEWNMSKYCVFCSDGNEYGDTQTNCPICGELLKRRKDNFTTIPVQQNAASSDVTSYYFPTTTSVPVTATDAHTNEQYFDDNLVMPQPQPAGRTNDISVYRQAQVDQNVNYNNSHTEMPAVEARVAHAPLAAGTVYNYREDNISSFWISRWLAALFFGDYYVFNNIENTFELDVANSDRSYEVIVKGRISRSKLADGTQVRVWGRRDSSSNSIIAHRIENIRTGSRLEVDLSLPASAVRLLTVGTVALISWLIYQATLVNWGYVFEKIAAAVALVLLGIFGFKSLFGKSEE